MSALKRADRFHTSRSSKDIVFQLADYPSLQFQVSSSSQILDASGVNTQTSDVIPAIDPLSGEFPSDPTRVEDDPECTPNPT